MNTYTKLRSGDWGVRIDAVHPKGRTLNVLVEKRNGDAKEETVTVFWSGKGVSLAAIAETKTSARRGSYSGRRNSRPRFEDDEGSSFPCHICGKFCYSGEHGYCKNNRY